MSDNQKIGVIPLVGLIIGAIVGAGIFNLMKEMALTASVGVTILGWTITGIGMGSLALCMQNLSNKRPDLNAGIFSYAQEGFGDYMGFNSVWGYWVSVIIGNVAYGTLLFSALGYFFPIFGNGQNVASIIGASIVLWIIHYLIIRGLNKVTLLNTVVMIAKLVPIILFIVCILLVFNSHIFFYDFWGTFKQSHPFSSVLKQLKGTVLSTVWVFIGVEGAVVFSGRAKKASDVGKATILGFGTVALIYALVTVLSFGVMTRTQLQHLPNPAMGYVLEKIIGKPGAFIINLGVIITIFGAWISNTLLAEEVSYQAGTRKLFPKTFTKENKHGMPNNATFITNLLVQLLLISFLFTDQAYSLLSKISSATILLSYICVALYQCKFTWYEKKDKKRTKNLFIGTISILYFIWLIYASGIFYFLLTILCILLGAIMFIYVKHSNREIIFKPFEKIIFAVIMLFSVYAIIRIISNV
ncbi:basic amino acid/polyamine antiporter [Bombilactobacillus bombi]|uniref:basic amino acid/polyamine antiporter n=1 Tax=Bombilactobacillus bombi TaxID=1303590 RepID=UPI0015E5E52D|nr:basic amino acid/polyamine antiporter [Bombilactobacillus bombi]MBA1433712.1 amino acid permease [Bombilactobacillus bombi]